MNVSVRDIKKLREKTGAGVLEVKEALEKFAGDFEAAKEDLIKKSSDKASKKSGREIKAGLVHSYIHSNGRLGSLVVVGCETDFVARTEDFKNLCHELAMQICTDEYKTNESLLSAEYMRDSQKRVIDIVNEVSVKTGEKIELIRFVKFSI